MIVFIVMHMANDYDVSSRFDSVYSSRELAQARVDEIDNEYEIELTEHIAFWEDASQHNDIWTPTRPTIPEIIEKTLDVK